MKKNKQIDTLDKVNAFKAHLIVNRLSTLLGNVLTIIDASIDGDKNKAVKDMVRQSFGAAQDAFQFRQHDNMYEISESDSYSLPIGEWDSGMIPVELGKYYRTDNTR